jgi:c(7)-type cytochrome triheme protein
LNNYQLKSKNSIKILLILAALSVFVVSCIKQNADKTDVVITAKDRNLPTPVKISDKSYNTFSHSVPEHKEINCDSCHKREANSLKLDYSGHDSCISCHLNEFTNPESGICTICHDDLQKVPATMKSFPIRFNEQFNMKFDHAAHSQGAGRPQAGCAACHQPQGAAQAIPVGINTHATCFTCHTPESKIGSCNYCHETAPYRRTVSTRTIFKAVFSHTDHTFRQGVNCNECHTVKAGAPQSKQVSTPVAVQHFESGGAVSCRTCHNDRRAFGEENFANCKRCHEGTGFDMLP